jgi:hypothetical protein
VREYSRRLVEAGASTTEADEIDRWTYLPFFENLGLLFINPRRALEGILVRISGWARLSNRAAFLRQNEIQIGIEQCYRDFTACTDRFTVRWLFSMRKGHNSSFFFLQVASSMVQNSESREREKERQRDHLQLIDLIAKLRQDVQKLHSMLLGALQSREQLPVSLAWLYCVDA